jgi:hypothetical protein
MFAMARAMQCGEEEAGAIQSQATAELRRAQLGARGGCKPKQPLQRKKENLRDFVRPADGIAPLSRIRPIEPVFLPPPPVFGKLFALRQLPPRRILFEKRLEGDCCGVRTV